jgi:3-methyladenine DNA glycosylase AlkD
MSHTLLENINAALHAAAEPGFQDRQQFSSTEAIKGLGVRTPAIRAIAKDHFPAVKAIPIEDLLDIADNFLALGTIEHRCIALVWAFRRRKDLQPVHFPRLEHWLGEYVQDWAACDQLCTEVFGDFMKRFPEFAVRTLEWARSENRWMRRAAAVILIPSLRDDARLLTTLFQVAEILLPDRDDLVQKGYGWALKEATEAREKESFAFIMQHRKDMSRTALRYAIEKLSREQKEAAMKNP